MSSKASNGKALDERSYACAAACVSVSRNIVHITTEMKRRGLLLGAYWFTMYTTFCMCTRFLLPPRQIPPSFCRNILRYLKLTCSVSILSLVFYVLEQPDSGGCLEILADANDGKDALAGLARMSQAADRCSSALKVS